MRLPIPENRAPFLDPTDWNITLEGEDITQHVLEITNLNVSLDVNDPIEFNSGRVRIVIKTHDLDNLKYKREIIIRADRKVVFSGVISLIDKKFKPSKTATVTVNDHSQDMRNSLIENFGISKRVRVTRVDDTDSGEYPWTVNLAPVSDESLENPRSAGVSLEVVDSFASEGNLDPTNISYDEETLRSEGRALAQNPDVTIKAPYRWKNILTVIREIIRYYGITNSNLSIDNFEVHEHFSTNGRVGYDLEHNLDESDPLREGAETAIFWTGIVTDFLYDEDDNKFYFLYSSRVSKPSIIEYDPILDRYREIFKRYSNAEYWRFVKQDNIFYILGTTISSIEIERPVRGAYDPTEHSSSTPSGTFIERVDISDKSLTSFVGSSPSHGMRAVVGMYYQFGFEADGRNNNVRQGIQPDTRKGFILHNNLLYYPYANSISCGIARANIDGTTPSMFVRIPRDNYFNHLGFDFDIGIDPEDNVEKLFGGATFQRETNSSRLIFKKSLS